jgi:hypothetical protein
MGPAGAGLAAKLARNLITYGSWLAAFEAQELAEAAGIDLLKLGEAGRESDKRIGGATRLSSARRPRVRLRRRHLITRGGRRGRCRTRPGLSRVGHPSREGVVTTPTAATVDGTRA